MFASKIKYMGMLKVKTHNIICAPVLGAQEMPCFGMGLNLAWNWKVMVDKGSNGKAKTKDKSGKSQRGLFCSPEH